jgi:hypothetical protein
LRRQFVDHHDIRRWEAKGSPRCGRKDSVSQPRVPLPMATASTLKKLRSRGVFCAVGLHAVENGVVVEEFPWRSRGRLCSASTRYRGRWQGTARWPSSAEESSRGGWRQTLMPSASARFDSRHLGHIARDRGGGACKRPARQRRTFMEAAFWSWREGSFDIKRAR